MNNLHRELAPITSEAWSAIEEEATRTFKRHIAGRRVVDLSGPHGTDYSAVGLGRTAPIAAPDDGVQARQRLVAPLVELRVPFTLSREELDNIERGAEDADLDPVKDAAKRIAWAEDRAIFEGYPAANITGIRASASNEPVAVPSDPRLVPEAVAQALSELRLAGVDGPYSVLLSADLYTAVSETSDHGHPIRTHIERLIPEGEIIWAPAIDGAFVLTTRGGDFDLQIGQDLSIGYLSHDAESVQLYFQQSLTFLVYTAEAAVALQA
ncbi:bacteriocin family protein [Nocardia cyriacigeorgica]|uniref:family 1 encapsulin nanocompartment shell protein n=1 Tax=Nocardia cyriacigeorgica TaxID=135487 RepID=UPI0013D7C758|nr:family 1 encapsulin nanocompartment shell protein [Nocardia cyriacigeorgica]MBF6097779.1 bacteriocin family protein [Nocardia cyriacigeorgica]MBF6161578.1 bacteriocin family protein [Nocardia cyriacigeorgica]MBF6200376.1 bacteriocin family protein [Nocardia cyriacigeorgica]MBF6316295.1 bacteriocin family protein [Nocardia cyriacigeorgica]MBF6342159.1 bacteriocin family protein [Nocardia cyriacigeorgica]